MVIPNRALSGLPSLPYRPMKSYQGNTLWIDYTILDHTGAEDTPTALQYRIDDITNSLTMVDWTGVTPDGPTGTIEVAGSLMSMSNDWTDSQLCQIWYQATLSDGSTVNKIDVVELIAIRTPTGC